MPEESAVEAKQDIFMTREHNPLKVTIEQKQVDKALLEARKTLEPRVEAKKQFAAKEGRPLPIGGGADARDKEEHYTGSTQGQEGEQEGSKITEEGFRRFSRDGDPLIDIIRESTNIDGIRWVLRSMLAQESKAPENRETYEYKKRMIRQILLDRTVEYRLASDNKNIGKIHKFGFAKYGFGGEIDEEWERQRIAEVELHDRRRAKMLQLELERKLGERLSPEEKQKKADAFEIMAEEIRILDKTNFIFEKNRSASGDALTLAQLFTHPYYSSLSVRELQFYFSLPKTEGERLSRGEKIDWATRLYVLIGIGGGSNGKEELDKVIKKIEERSRAVGKEPWTNQLNDGDKKFLVGKGIFCDRFNASQIPAIREWVARWIGGDETDSRAAEKEAWKFIYWSGFAPQLDNRKVDDEATKYIGKSTTTPLGYPVSDDLVKAYHYNSFLIKDATAGRPHGPHATLGEYPENLFFSFLHYLTTGEGENTRSFYEKWLYEGVSLGDLPWAKLGKEEGAQMEEQALEELYSGIEVIYTSRGITPEEAEQDPKKLKNIRAEITKLVDDKFKDLKEGGINTLSWRSHLLRLFLFFREAGQGPDKPGGVWQIATREWWDFDDLMNRVTLEAINKALDIALDNDCVVTKGEWADWIDEQKGKSGVTTLDNDTVKKLLQKERDLFIKQMRQLILFGAAIRHFEAKKVYAALDWGVLLPSGFGALFSGLGISELDRKKAERRRDKKIPDLLERTRFKLENYEKFQKNITDYVTANKEWLLEVF